MNIAETFLIKRSSPHQRGHVSHIGFQASICPVDSGWKGWGHNIGSNVQLAFSFIHIFRLKRQKIF